MWRTADAGGSLALASIVFVEEGDVQMAHRLPLRPLSSAVVAGGCAGVCVSGELLGSREVSYRVQEILDKRLCQ